MNFEHLCKLIYQNKTNLKNKFITKKFLKYQYEILQIKKNKLKLGAVTFDLINTFVDGYLISQQIEMRYIKQDNTEKEEMKLENRLKALNWKWNYSNILALIIILIFLIIFIIAAAYTWYYNNLPDFANKNPKYDILIEKSLNILLISNNLNCLKFLLFSNIMLIDSMITLCSFFNILF